MIVREVAIDGLAAARLALPDDRPPSQALVALHGAGLPAAVQPLFEHLAGVATPLGCAVLSYDRRPVEVGDVPLQHQADDALAALHWVGYELDVPVGVFGFSQGAWAASLAAAQSARVSELVLVGCSGVSPAAQMRYSADESLRRNGFSDADRASALELRSAVEEVFRGTGDRERVGQMLARASTEPWFGLTYLPTNVPASDQTWEDMDYDPALALARITCPTLLLYGEDEECVPASQSKQVWRSAATRAELTVADVFGCGHFPSPVGAGQELDDISPAYTALLADWLAGSGRPVVGA